MTLTSSLSEPAPAADIEFGDNAGITRVANTADCVAYMATLLRGSYLMFRVVNVCHTADGVLVVSGHISDCPTCCQ